MDKKQTISSFQINFNYWRGTMKQVFKICVFPALFFLFFVGSVFADSDITGKWKTIDDKTGEPQSIVNIYEQNGKYYGQIVELFRKPTEDPNPICDKCPNADPRKNQQIRGMIILNDLVKDGNEYSGGTILDPKEGKIYRCKVWIENGELKLRGYIAFFFRTQTWKKVY
jgi:uncharacterized protein (DUF2147 family)